MFGRLTYDLGRAGLRLILQLWPVWLMWVALQASVALWRDLVLLAPGLDRGGIEYRVAYTLWPAAGLLGPILLMAIAVGLHVRQWASPAMGVAGLLGVAGALGLTLWPAWASLAPLVGLVPPLEIVGRIPGAYVIATVLGIAAIGVGAHVMRSPLPGSGKAGARTRARSDNHGHADWLLLREARRLFPGPDPVHGGIVLGEAYRVDEDRAVRRRGGFGGFAGSGGTGDGMVPFDPEDRATWGQGGRAPLLVDPCRTGPTHGLVLAGSGGYKTTAIGIPTLLTWTGSAVVLDPSREIGPMLGETRRTRMGHRVVTLDPAAGGRDPRGAAFGPRPVNGSAKTGLATSGSPMNGFNALDWIDVGSPLAEANVEAVATWLVGEPARGTGAGSAEFFRDMGQSLIACLLADLLWDKGLTPRDKTLRQLRRVLVTPEAEMRGKLETIHATSTSALARDLAGTLMGLVDETFSGVYANASQATRWLSTAAYADLVSGDAFETRELCDGNLTIFVQIPLKVLQATPGLGRVVIGALLNAAYEADGAVKGRILFLLDEVARLGPMALLEAARDAGRKYRLTLLLLYQSQGQLNEQWGREGARAWADGTSWRLYAALQDPETAGELSQVCGEHGVVAASEGDTRGTSGRWGGATSASAGRSANRSEMRRSLVKPDELLQDTRADEAFVITRGAKPLRCGRAIYFRRPDMVVEVAPSRFQPDAAAQGRPAQSARPARRAS
ncbi:type IV secretion system protein VirD4 [Palleronia aestuarii]|uniref:Type IV secretion system protein VirD4 n=1 Tax=Palleronia aestuarii TaxID=568105 RepID=A0A2W7NC64_9RHOB|nr:type IV secretory system conjugative DNA transfer family protein [Palleronia aestuarii]PZX14314.1 type IV secretion system protein VirD4 [Palleronia aestuarii]